MKCVTCTADIPPAFVHAIQSNTCPGCAGPIMSDESKKLMDDLKEAMASMPNDPEGLAGWLLSTYDLFPKGTVSPTNFHRPQQLGPSGPSQGPGGGLKWANSPTSNKFAEAAGVAKLMADPKRAEVMMIQNIHSSAETSMYGGEQEPEDKFSIEEQEIIKQQELEELKKRAIQRGHSKPTAQDLLANNVQFGNTEGENANISSEEISVLRNVFEGTNTNLNALDAIPQLQADRQKRMYAQAAISGGGNSSFRR